MRAYGGKITYLKVPPDAESHAKRFGARRDHGSGAWFVVGPIPSELENYVPRQANQQFYEVAPPCPLCGAPTRKLVNRGGQPYWSCLTRFTSGCKGVVDYLDYLDEMSPTVSVGDFLPKVVGSLFGSGQSAVAPVKGPPEALKTRWEQIVCQAASVLGSDRQAIAWLFLPKVVLGNKAPVDVLVTDAGCDKVLQLLKEVWR